MKKFKIALLGILLLILTACGNLEKNNTTNTEANNDEKKLTIMTSIFPLYDFTSKIAGDRAEVINLIPAGAEPHDFEPAPKDMITLSKANIFIYNGGGYETWVEDVLTSIDQENISVLNVSENLDLLTLEETGGEDHHHHHHGEEANHEEVTAEDHHHHHHGEEGNHEKETAEEDHHDHGEDTSYEDETELSDEDEYTEEYDPHVWLDPLRAKQIAEMIKDELIKVDSEGKKTYEKNFNELAAKFDDLDEKYKVTLNNPVQKNIIVSHAAFGYLTNRYGLNQISISGLSPSDEPSPQELIEIISFANENNIKYILFETLVNPKVSETVQNKIGAKSLTLNPLEGLTQEELAEGKDYFSVMLENLETLKIATGSESQ